jgi:hypothetical protein
LDYCRHEEGLETDISKKTALNIIRKVDMTMIKTGIKENSVATRPTLNLWQRFALVFVVLLALVAAEALAEDTKPQKSTDSGTKHGSLSELSAKLSDPTSDVWALFTEFDVSWSRGDLSDDDYKAGGDMIFQPIMPFHLTKDLKLLTRPTVPVIFSTPVPTGLNLDGTADFDYKAGLGDISLPLMFSPVPKPGQSFSWGFGPTLQFPTHTSTDLGTKTWEVGPAAVVTHKTKKTTMGLFGQYWLSYSEYGNNSMGEDTKSTSHGSILPFFYYNLPDAWSIGFSPTITYNDKATSGNKWNVPFGPTVAKMTMIGKLPVKFQLGIEYAVARQDDFGPEWRIKFNIIPVIMSLQKKPFF